MPSQTPTTYAAARAVLDDYGHTPRTRDYLGVGVSLPVDHGWEPISLSEPDSRLWWPGTFFGDWVSADLAGTSGPGPVVYRLDTPWNPADARPVLSFRPVDRNKRQRWAVRDWSSRDGVRSGKPLDALLTVLGDLDRLSAVIDRTWTLAASTPGEATAKLWRREADELDAFRTEHERRNVGPLAAQWLATEPALPPTQPTRPPLVAARLR